MSTDEADAGGLVVAVLMLAASGWVFWEAGGYTELAAAFPRTIALVMAVASAALIVRCLLRRERRVAVDGGSSLRRGAMFLALVGWVALIPIAGFFLASVLGFATSGLVARHESWALRRWIGFAGLALLAVASFHRLFSRVLMVPFPRGLSW